MIFSFEQHDEFVVARLPSSLSLANAAAVRSQLERHIQDESAELIVDLSGVEFIDSSGLAALLSTCRAARSWGGDIVLAGPLPRVQALIELTRLDDVVDVVADITEASSRLASRREAA